MKSKDFKELRGKNADDLQKMLDDRRRDLMDLRFSLATGALENPARIGQVKRDIAQVLTVLNESRLVGAGAE